MSPNDQDPKQGHIANKIEEIIANARQFPSDLAETVLLQGAIDLSKIEHGKDSSWGQREPSAQAYALQLRQLYYKTPLPSRESA